MIYEWQRPMVQAQAAAVVVAAAAETEAEILHIPSQDESCVETIVMIARSEIPIVNLENLVQL